MKVSMKVDYGVRALVDLAQRFGQGPVQTNEIATRQGIPEPYLDQLLATMSRAGYIKSRRGPQGGHFLAREPGQITVGEVIMALEGTVAPIACVDTASECPQYDTCATREVWQAVKSATQGVLDATSIEELADRQRRQEERMYYI